MTLLKFIPLLTSMSNVYLPFLGPIVRITPDELSIHDPEFYDQLYVVGSVRRTDNYNHFAKGVGFDGTSGPLRWRQKNHHAEHV